MNETNLSPDRRPKSPERRTPRRLRHLRQPDPRPGIISPLIIYRPRRRRRAHKQRPRRQRQPRLPHSHKRDPRNT